MVKNTKGGNKSKKQGKKHIIDFNNKKILLKECDNQSYAVVLKLLGGNNCLVLCEDNTEKLCIIRKKFRGRGKRDNIISIGSWTLVSLRAEWNENTKCDLEYVYKEKDKSILVNNKCFDWYLNLTNKNIDDDYLIEFTNDVELANNNKLVEFSHIELTNDININDL